MEEENNNNFEVISSKTSNANFKQNKQTKQNSFGKTVLIPFASGIVGCSLVLGTCFGIPSIKEKLVGKQSSTVQTSTQTASGTTSNLVSLSNFSNTAVFASNKILPSIVGIEVSYTVTSNSIGSFFGYSQPQNSTATATGSGIIISEDGYIVTNNHVVDSTSSNSYYELSKATSIKIKLNSDTYGDDATYDATVVGQDSQTDLAVLKIEKTGLTAAEFADSDQAVVGEFVMAVGSPLGLDTTVTQGIVSAVNREVESDGTKYTCIQTDAAINSGNSGGALINSDGKVIGINTLKLSGTGVEGIGFAIPINSATDVINQLKDHQKVLRPYIGITGINLDEQTAKRYKLEVGVYIKSIEDFSPAEKAGLKAGDVIVKADGKSITTKDELNEIIEEVKKINFNRYPDNDSIDIRKAYANVIGVSEENIIAGNGSDEMISLIIDTQITKRKTVLTINPDFSMYDFYTSLNDGIIKKYNTEKDGEFSVSKFITYGKKVEPKVIIFSNPNNPTGHVISSEDIIFILESFKDTLVVVDEAYYEFYGQSMIGYIEIYKNLVVTRTLSKAWGLAALRIGFLIANKELIKSLNLSKVPYNLNTFSQLVGCIVLRHPERILKNVEEIVHERERLYKRLNEIQKNSNDEIKFYKSKSNFIFGRTKNKEKLKKALEDKGILIRYFEDDSFRISVGSPLENDFIVNIIGNNMCEVREKCEENISN